MSGQAPWSRETTADWRDVHQCTAPRNREGPPGAGPSCTYPVTAVRFVAFTLT